MATVTKPDTARIASAVGDAHQMAVLLQWVENARQLIGWFETLDMHNEEFAALCKRADIPVFYATWEAEHSRALARLLSIQCQFLNAAQDAAEGGLQ